jgi:hypothetical protein
MEISPGIVENAADIEDQMDEPALAFDAVQGVNPTTRRYSEPDTSGLFRKFFLTSQSLSHINVAKSDGGIEGIDLPPTSDEQTQQRPEGFTFSERRRQRSRRR